MTTMNINISDIEVANRMRSLKQEAVDGLKESIKKIGLHTPLSVRRSDQGVTPWVLVTGMHRLRACIELGMNEVEVREENGTETDARLWEIAENLHRADLSTLERNQHVADWVRLTEEKGEVSGQFDPKPHQKGVGQGVGGGRPVSGVRSAVRELGIDRMEARRSISRVENIPLEVREEIKDTPIADSGVQLDALAKAKDTPELQAEAVKAVKTGKAKDVRDVLPTPKRKSSGSGKPKESAKKDEQESGEKSNKVVPLHQPIVTPPKSDVVVRPDANLDLCCFMLERIIDPSLIKEGDVERLHEIVLRTYNERIQLAFSNALDKLGVISSVKRYYP